MPSFDLGTDRSQRSVLPLTPHLPVTVGGHRVFDVHARHNDTTYGTLSKTLLSSSFTTFMKSITGMVHSHGKLWDVKHLDTTIDSKALTRGLSVTSLPGQHG